MPNQSNRYDDPENLRRNREVRERSNSSSISPKDFIRLQAERKERKKRADGIEKSMAQQKAAQDQIDKQLVNRENKDTDPPEFPFIRTKEYEDIRANALQAAEGRRMETIAPESPKVEQGLSRERQNELAKPALSEIQSEEDSKRNTAVDIKSESDRSTSVSDNTNASRYEREIKQIQELMDTEEPVPVYAYFNRRESSVYVTDRVENVVAKYGPDIANLEEGARSGDVQRIELEFAKMGIEDERYRLKPDLDITALQVEKPQDKKADAIRPQDGIDAQREARKEVLDALNKMEIGKMGWGDLLDEDGKPKPGTTVYWKESTHETFYYEKDGSILVSLNKKENEQPISVFDAAKKVREQGFRVMGEDQIYAARYDGLEEKEPKFLITNDPEALKHMVSKEVGYNQLSEGKTTPWTSVEEFVGADRLNELPEWARKFNIEDFAEYRPDLKAEDFIKLAQNKPLEQETVSALEQEEHFDQGVADTKERLSRVEKTFAEDDKGKEFNEIKENLDKLYARISERGVPEDIFKQAEEQKDRAEIYPIQIESFFKLKEANLSLNEQYKIHYNRMVKDMKESVEFMEKALDQSRRQDISASSKRESKDKFVSSVENALGKKDNTGKVRQFSEKMYDGWQAKGLDKNDVDLIIRIMKANKQDISKWLDTKEEVTDSDVQEANNWLMKQINKHSLHQSEINTNEMSESARRQLEREMGIHRTGETKA